MSAGTGLFVAITPIVVAVIGALGLYLKRKRHASEAASRSSRSRAEIDRILLDAKIREAKQREAEGSGLQ
jgi:hypothetical protein